MGTTLVLPKIVEVLAPEGEYEKGRIKLRGEYSAVLAKAKQVTEINSAEDSESVTAFGRLLQVATKETEEFFKGIKSQIDLIKKPILANEKEDIIPYMEEKVRLGAMQTKWIQKVRKEQEEAERKAREDALQKAREEQLQRAIDMEMIEGTDAGLEVLEEPVVALPSVVLSKASKPTGTVSKVSYSVQIVSMMALIKAVAEGRAPAQALIVNESWLNSKARLDKEAYSVPGTELLIREGTHFRS